MALTNNLGLALIEQGQAQKEVTANQAFAKIDAVLNMSVIDRDVTAPPVSPSAGDAYIPHATATGAWAGHENDIAYYYNSAWNFIAPKAGMAAKAAEEQARQTGETLQLLNRIVSLLESASRQPQPTAGNERRRDGDAA
ncbi:MAG: DUF2793 domain-containing protein [Rickettsiales bacterium]